MGEWISSGRSIPVLCTHIQCVTSKSTGEVEHITNNALNHDRYDHNTKLMVAGMQKTSSCQSFVRVLNHNMYKHSRAYGIIGLVHRAVPDGHAPWPGGLNNFETVNGGTEPVLIIDIILRFFASFNIDVY